MSAEPERRLAAILSADVAGYARLMADDEDATVRTLRAWREQVGALITEHRGRLADFTGDNFLAEFAAARDAVECALAIQRVVEARNSALPEPRRMRFRIGAHLGDVRHENGRLFGDGVNVAARLQPLADPGGVCISSTLADVVRGKLAIALEDMGEQALKNIPEAVRVYRARAASDEATGPAPTARPRWLAPAAALAITAIAAAAYLARDRESPAAADAATAASDESAALAPIRSLAVLPLTNLSGDPEQEYFADGMTETLIAELAKLPGVRVISRTSVMQFKHTSTPLPEIAKTLNVDGVIEGSVMRAGSEVRITTQLIDARSDRHLWAEHYDRELARVLEIQSEVARAVAGEIAIALTPQQARRLAPPKVVDARAQDAYLRGLALRGHADSAGMQRAMSAFEEAIEIAPDFAPAHAALATARCFVWVATGAPLANESRLAATRALELDPNLGDAYIARARVLALHDWRWVAAERQARRGAELGASDPLNRSALAYLMLMNGHPEEAFAYEDEVVASAPLDLFVRNERAFLLLIGGRPDDAIEEIGRILAIEPEYSLPIWTRAMSYERLGRLGEALRDWREMARLSPEFARTVDELERAWRADGALGYWRAAARDTVARDNLFRAVAFAQAGSSDDAFAALERGVQARDARIGFLRVYEGLAPLRKDPRFADLARRINLPLAPH